MKKFLSLVLALVMTMSLADFTARLKQDVDTKAIW